MYLGKIVEMAAADELFTHPMHPYTQALLSAIPSARPGMAKARILLSGDMPSPLNPPSECRFHIRCPKALPQCKTEEPMWKEIGAEALYGVPSELMANDPSQSGHQARSPGHQDR